jgi:hypothetical protein
VGACLTGFSVSRVGAELREIISAGVKDTENMRMGLVPSVGNPGNRRRRVDSARLGHRRLDFERGRAEHQVVHSG